MASIWVRLQLLPFALAVEESTAGNEKKCNRQKGFCAFGSCPFGYKFVGLCSTFRHCCKSIWG
uniref:Beta-defensin-like domain-containing protein n=1 Tax=Aquila chrysaetos chrysaetos TaxID=223781 RepID=A0A663EK64_AQUCH